MADEPIKEESADSTTTTTEASPPEAQKIAAHKIPLSIWPPSQRTRDAIVQRLIITLSTQSIISKRYGIVPAEEATDLAARIEDESYAAANPATLAPDDDGIEILQKYSQEISRRMLDTVKARSGSAVPPATAAAPAEVQKEADEEVEEPAGPAAAAAED